MTARPSDIDTLYTVLAELVLGLPDNVADLEGAWRDNRHAFWRMQTEAHERWQALVDLATARKKVLVAGGHLTPETGTRQGTPAWFKLTVNEQPAYFRGK